MLVSAAAVSFSSVLSGAILGRNIDADGKQSHLFASEFVG
jgi:hypothetical protein